MVKIGRGLVVHLTSVHPTKDVRIFFKECRTLAKSGYEVRLVAQGEREEIIDGVRLIPFKRVTNRLVRFTLTAGRVLVLALRQHADVYHFHDPELMPVGLVLKLIGKRVIYDVHEGYNESTFDRDWIPRPMRWLVAHSLGLFELVAANAFDAVVAATPHIAERFPPRKTFIVRNFPMLGELVSPDGQPFASRPPEFAFVGHISRNRGAISMVAAVGGTSDDRIRLHLGCPFNDEGLKNELAAMPGWRRVIAHGWMSRTQIADLYGRVLAGVIVFQPTKNYYHALPTKFFEYMSAGLPAIVSNFPALQEIVDKHRCAIAVDPENSGEIARAMDWIVSNPEDAAAMGARGRQAVFDDYNWDREAQQLLACYDAVLS
jgi:glycosyltransferase involved in cell wall biosynthesis